MCWEIWSYWCWVSHNSVNRKSTILSLFWTISRQLGLVNKLNGYLQNVSITWWLYHICCLHVLSTLVFLWGRSMQLKLKLQANVANKSSLYLYYRLKLVWGLRLVLACNISIGYSCLQHLLAALVSIAYFALRETLKLTAHANNKYDTTIMLLTHFEGNRSICWLNLIA